MQKRIRCFFLRTREKLVASGQLLCCRCQAVRAFCDFFQHTVIPAFSKLFAQLADVRMKRFFMRFGTIIP